VYVAEAFSNAHRNHASMVEVAKLLPSYMGFALEREVVHLNKIIHETAHPLTLIIGGAKLETKIPIISNFLTIGDDILIGGAVANTFIAARGFDVGTSKYDEGSIDIAQNLMLESEKDGRAVIHVPRDAVVATEAVEGAEKIDIPLEDVGGDMAIFDIGTVSVKRFCEVIAASKMIIWNGPVGLFEINRFSHASKRIAEAMAAATKNGAMTVVGGGDTLDFHERYGYDLSVYTFVSMGGGAMLEFLAGKELPSIVVLEEKNPKTS
jgi:phosphoglycerate kinase